MDADSSKACHRCRQLTSEVHLPADEVAVEHGKEIARMNRTLSDKDRQLRRLQIECADHKEERERRLQQEVDVHKDDSELLSNAQRELEGLRGPPSKSSDS